MNNKNNSSRVLAVVNIVAYVAVVAMNVLSNTLPLNGRTAGDISDALPSYFTPAGYTFSIWSLIYLGLLGFTIYQALPAQRNAPWLRQIGWLFALSSAANIAWLFAWHYGVYALSVVLMVGLLLTLIAIAVRLGVGRPHPTLSLADRLLVHVPFSLYLGWITVATIANIASVSAHFGWDGFGIDGQVWSAIMMMIAAIVGGLFLYRRRNLAYAGVLVWALFGIRSAYPDEPVIATTSLVAAGLVILFAIVGYVRTSSPPVTVGDEMMSLSS